MSQHSGPTTAPDWARLVLAPNAGPMTLEGTNTWVLGEPGTPSIVLDPGPADRGHLERVAALGPIGVVVLSHRHHDHSDGVDLLREIAGAMPVLAADPTFVRDADRLTDGQGLGAGALAVEVMATPGHTSDSVCLHATVGVDRVVLTGDTVLGRGTTILDHPDGRLGDYLESLRRLSLLGAIPVLPGHGPVLPDLTTVVGAYLTHRAERLEEVRAALAVGATGVQEVVARVYADVDPRVLFAARASVRAQLTYLVEAGELDAVAD